MPDHVGFEMSGPTLPDYSELQYILMEMHYDNPLYLSNITDNSGIRVYYTNKLRNQTAGLLDIGVAVAKTQFIPANIESFINYGYCTSKCTIESIPESGVNIFGSFLHAHTAGVSLILRHISYNGTELEPVEMNLNYDFDYQQTTLLLNEIKFIPGDQFILECEYNTQNRDSITWGGLSTNNEMCIVFLHVYPKPELHRCWSSHYPDDIEVFAAVSSVYEYVQDLDDFNYNISVKGALEWYQQLWDDHTFENRYQFCLNANQSHITSEQNRKFSVKELNNYTKYEYPVYCNETETDTDDSTNTIIEPTTTYSGLKNDATTYKMCGFVISSVIASCILFVNYN